MARYIKTPLQDKNISITGKVLCLIDTDIEAKTFEQDNSLDNLLVKRLLNINNNIELVDINDIRKIPATEIEDALEPLLYIQTLEHFNNPDILKVLGESDFIESANNSADCMDLKVSGRLAIKEFFQGQDIKYLFAKKYVEFSELDLIGVLPDWVQQIKAEFAEVKPKVPKRRKPSTATA